MERQALNSWGWPWRVLVASALVWGLVMGGDPAKAQGPGRRGPGPGPGMAPRPPAKPADPKAVALAREVAKAYKALQSYSDDGKFVVSMNVGGKDQRQTVPQKLTLVKPNKLELETPVVRLTSDGKTITTAVIPLKRYTAAPAPAEIGFETFRQGPTGAVLFGGPTGVTTFVLLNFLTAPDPVAALGQLGGSLQLAPEDAKAGSGGAGHPALLIDQVDGPDIRMEIDPTTKLLSGIELKIDPKALAQSAQAGRPVSIERFGWNSGKVSTEVAKDRPFAYQPPEGFNKVDSLMEQPKGPDGQRRFAIQARLGKPAPEFTLTVLDGPGKTRTVTRSELAGKVVVIDFWATWCGPCLKELPELDALVKDLTKAKKDVVFVALSQDREPEELADVRKLVEKTLTDRKAEFIGSPVAKVALDPSNTIGQAFEVEGLPTTVVLDAKGVVQAVHVGLVPNIRRALTAQIDALLAGKTLATPESSKPVEAADKGGKDKGKN